MRSTSKIPWKKRSYYIYYIIYAGFRLPVSHSRTTSMSHIFVMRQSVLPLHSHRSPRRNPCYRDILHSTTSASQTAKKSKPFKSRKHSWNTYFWMHNRVLTCTIVELILFSVKLQVCFLQEPEFCFRPWRSTFEKGKTLHQSKISTLDNSKLLGSPFIIFKAFSGSWASLQAMVLQPLTSER